MKKFFLLISTIILNIWFYFWAPFVLLFSLLFYTPFVAFFRIFRPSRTMYYFRKCINLYGRSVTYTAWPWIKVKIHELPDEKGIPYVFVENHTSSFDPFVQGFIPYELVQAARGWALKLPVLGFVARLAGYLDVDALKGELLLEKSIKRLNEGISVVFFPEGTRHEKEMGPFHSTAFKAAFDTESPVVPVIIKGIVDKPRKGSLIMHPGRIDIFCLNSIQPEEYKNKSHMALKKMVRARMEKFLK